MAELRIIEIKGGKRTERTIELLLNMKAIRIAEKRTGHALAEYFGDAPRKMGFGDAMEIVAAGMLHSVPSASVTMVENFCEADPTLALRLMRAASEAIIEAFTRMMPAAEDERPTSPQGESDPSP